MKKITLAISCMILIQTGNALTSRASTNPVHASVQPTLSDTVPPKDSNRIYDNVEAEAYFPGREEGWLDYLQQNLNASIPVNNGAPAGTYTVMVQFVVSTNGRISAIKPLTKHGFGMEGEVVRILRKSPSWVPAVQDGHAVNAYRKQPVTFMVIDENKKKRRRG